MEKRLSLPNITPFSVESNEFKTEKRKANSSNDIFRFGKYKGKRISDVIKTDPRYVDWLNRNYKQFKLSSDQLMMLSEYLSKYDNMLNNN